MPPILYMQDFSPPSRAVLLTAEAIGLKLETKILDLSKGEHLSDSFLQVNPQHTIPTLDDNGTIIWDSHAINAYLVGKYATDDALYPKDLAKRAKVDQRLHCDNGLVFSWLRYIARGMKYKNRKGLTPDQAEALEEAFNFLNIFLEGNRWVAGDSITIADFSVICNITAANFLHPVDPEKFPNVISWIKRMEALPYYHVTKEGMESYKKMFRPFLK